MHDMLALRFGNNAAQTLVFTDGNDTLYPRQRRHPGRQLQPDAHHRLGGAPRQDHRRHVRPRRPGRRNSSSTSTRTPRPSSRPSWTTTAPVALINRSACGIITLNQPRPGATPTAAARSSMAAASTFTNSGRPWHRPGGREGQRPRTARARRHLEHRGASSPKTAPRSTSRTAPSLTTARAIASSSSPARPSPARLNVAGNSISEPHPRQHASRRVPARSSSIPTRSSAPPTPSTAT